MFTPTIKTGEQLAFIIFEDSTPDSTPALLDMIDFQAIAFVNTLVGMDYGGVDSDTVCFVDCIVHADYKTQAKNVCFSTRTVFRGLQGAVGQARRFLVLVDAQACSAVGGSLLIDRSVTWVLGHVPVDEVIFVGGNIQGLEEALRDMVHPRTPLVTFNDKTLETPLHELANHTWSRGPMHNIGEFVVSRIPTQLGTCELWDWMHRLGTEWPEMMIPPFSVEVHEPWLRVLCEWLAVLRDETPWWVIPTSMVDVLGPASLFMPAGNECVCTGTKWEGEWTPCACGSVFCDIVQSDVRNVFRADEAQIPDKGCHVVCVFDTGLLLDKDDQEIILPDSVELLFTRSRWTANPTRWRHVDERSGWFMFHRQSGTTTPTVLVLDQPETLLNGRYNTHGWNGLSARCNNGVRKAISWLCAENAGGVARHLFRKWMKQRGGRDDGAVKPCTLIPRDGMDLRGFLCAWSQREEEKKMTPASEE